MALCTDNYLKAFSMIVLNQYNFILKEVQFFVTTAWLIPAVGMHMTPLLHEIKVIVSNYMLDDICTCILFYTER